MNHISISAIKQSVKGIESIEEIRSTRGAATYKIQHKGEFHALKIMRNFQPKHEIKYNHDYRLNSIVREGKLLEQLSHSFNMLSYYGQDATHTWVATKWIEGESLLSIAKNIRENTREVEQKRKFLALIIRIFEKISLLHQEGFLHGDLQPAHILLAADEVYLLDFGLARKIDEDAIYKGSLVHYVAPEVAQQMRDKKPNIFYDIITEVYSAASLAFWIYTQKTSTYYGTYDYKSVPFTEKLKKVAENGASNEFQNCDVIPFPELENILHWCMEKDRSKRCSRLSKALERLESIEIV